jgi:hypothetical protein
MLRPPGSGSSSTDRALMLVAMFGLVLFKPAVPASAVTWMLSPTPAGSSRISSGVSSAERTSMSRCSTFLNPESSVVTVYRPGSSAGTR